MTLSLQSAEQPQNSHHHGTVPQILPSTPGPALQPQPAQAKQPTKMHPPLHSHPPADPKPRRNLLTILPGLLDEGLHPAFTIAALGGQGGDVIPLEGFDNVHHGLGLVGVGWDHAGEEVVAAVVAQVRRGGGVADLGDLETDKASGESCIPLPCPRLACAPQVLPWGGENQGIPWVRCASRWA